MPVSFENYLVIAVSSRALFDVEMENQIFEERGLNAYREYQMLHQEDILRPGRAFSIIKSILSLNEEMAIPKKVEVVIMSRNNAEFSLRITKSLEHHNLNIIRSAWTSGASVAPYLKAFGVDLFLSANARDVQEAINQSIAAARILTREPDFPRRGNSEIRIAFDGDAVIFSDESEKVYKEKGLDAFLEHEKINSTKPLPDGPFAKLLRSLSIIQRAFPLDSQPIRLALITARNSPAHERVIRTLSEWGVRIDEVFFLGGREKHQIIRAFNPDFYFDDQDVYCDASSHVVPTGKVPWRESGI